MLGLKETNLKFPNQTGFYRGKVRDVYHFEDKLVIVASTPWSVAHRTLLRIVRKLAIMASFKI